ncbi:uncharacterized protein LOC126366945 [Pectinophora gossypiella]|uniref:uncharacterized protein LOC126366945 n=1 Tax=Pectinophora gossypiella TaxID=13191 RepID=UPI00214E8EE4|nr:uncharacterized protein LOC126366945 [Pectinophora gossypiella]
MAKPSRRKANVSAACQNTGEIVLSAIKKLMKNTGWTARTIVKFIKMEYTINDPNISRKVSRALKRGVRLGLLMMDRGRYRLNDMSRLARPIEAREIRGRQARMNEAKETRVRQRRGTRERPLRLYSRSCSRANIKRKS